jgi:hypothetical protein
MNSYYNKYIKYKEKYLKLKSQYGGANFISSNKDIEDIVTKWLTYEMKTLLIIKKINS